MTKSKKILGIVLALAMVFGCVTMASAALVGNEAASVTVTSSAAKLAAGETATITVAATTNFNVGTYSIPVFFNKTLVDVSAVSAANAAAVTATDTTSANADKVYANTGMDKATYGFVLVNYIAESGDSLSKLNNTTVLTFTVTAKADVTGDAVVSVPTGALKTTTNSNGTLYFGATTSATLDGAVDNVEAVTLTAASTTITIGAAATPNTIAVKAGFVDTVIVDTEVKDVCLDWCSGEYDDAIDAGADITGFIYGAEVFDVFLEDVLTTALGDDKLVITRTELAGEYDSTGTKIEVLNADGTVAETYYYIYFGDTNGDGLLDTEDVSSIVDYNKTGIAFETLAAYIASDVNGDTFTDTSDTSIVAAANASGDLLDQAGIAAAFYAEYHAAL